MENGWNLFELYNCEIREKKQKGKRFLWRGAMSDPETGMSSSIHFLTVVGAFCLGFTIRIEKRDWLATCRTVDGLKNQKRVLSS